MSRGRRALTKAGVLVVVLGVLLAAYLALARPRQLRWGATEAEVRRVMPGDSVNPHPAFLATRAITVAAAPGRIWPWLIQMGYGRAGFYGYDIMENLGSPRGLRSADHIVPELQHFKSGDTVPISVAATMQFGAVEPGRYLTWVGKAAGTWGVFTWALYPQDTAHTRLVSRIRWSHHWGQPRLLALDLFSEFTDHLAVRKILTGVRDRVEGHVQTLAWQVVECAAYVVAALVLFAAMILIVVRSLTWRRIWVTLAAGVAWLAVWYGPDPPWIGMILEVPVVWVIAGGRIRIRAANPAGSESVGGGAPPVAAA